MTKARCSDHEFIELWHKHRSATKVARILNVAVGNIHQRRRNIEIRHKVSLITDKHTGSLYAHNRPAAQNHARVHLGIEDGLVFVFSDAHFWPGIRTTAYAGLLVAIREMQPKAVICNGDAFDGASISRYPRIGWDNKPSVIQELKACEAALGEIEETTKKARHNAKLVWTLGNHDARFENRLAANASEFEGVKGFTLKDHFPAWTPAWSCWPTDNVVIKHRYKNGIHATHNNTVGGGKSIVTGHLHSLKVTPYNDYNGTRYGVDTGTLADPNGPQFVDYLEDNPTNWRSGFAILTFYQGMLLWPEVVNVFAPGYIQFRGQVVKVC